MTDVSVWKPTEKQDKFIELILIGMNRTKAAEMAGYSSPERASYDLMRNPHIVRAIAETTGRHVAGLTGLALNALHDLLDVKTPPATRLLAVREVLDRAGVGEKFNVSNGKDDASPVASMTEAQLEATLANVEKLRASLHNALTPRVIDHQPIDIIGEDTTV